MAATIASVVQQPLGPGLKLITGTVTLATPHAAGGDALDLSGYFSGEVAGGWPIDETDGMLVCYNRAAAGAVATGQVHAYKGEYTNVADGPLVTCAGDALAAVSFEMAFVGY